MRIYLQEKDIPKSCRECKFNGLFNCEKNKQCVICSLEKHDIETKQSFLQSNAICLQEALAEITFDKILEKEKEHKSMVRGWRKCLEKQKTKK